MATLNKATRFIQPGVTVIYFLPTVASITAVTRSEITAGTKLIDLAECSGWNTTSNNIDAPDFDSKFVPKVDGMVSADDSTLTFYGDKDGDDVRTVLPRGTTGYILWMDGGDVETTGKMDVFPVTVSSLSKQRSNSDVFQIQASFAITSEPDEDQAIPAAA